DTGAVVFLNCRERLVRVFRTLRGVADVFPLETEVTDADFHLHLAELPALFEAYRGDVWPGGPYLHAEPIRLTASGKRVGLVWGADIRHWEAADRTAALAEMAPVAEAPGGHSVSLRV